MLVGEVGGRGGWLGEAGGGRGGVVGVGEVGRGGGLGEVG